MKITFTNVFGIEVDKPKPASKMIPSWYKELESYRGSEKKTNGQGMPLSTIKKCMPVFDAITAGYIITLPADIRISQKDGQPWYEWANLGMIDFHPLEQAPTHPHNNGHISYPKLINPWAIKTPKGYSVLLVQPFHRESPFNILPGVVDTDTYTPSVNFPFVLNDINYEGIVPEGTPIVQVIPFKRESWKMEIGGEKEIKEANSARDRLNNRFFDKYKTLFRSPKEYK